MSNTSTSRLEDKAVNILDRLDSLATSYVPEAMDAAISATMVSGFDAILGGLIGLVCAYGVWFSAKKLAMFFVKKKEREGIWSDGRPVGLMAYWCSLPDLPVMEGAGEGLDLSEDGEGL